MEFFSTYTQLCRQTGQTVTIVASVEAEGGFGCAVGQDSVSYECSMEEQCPARREGLCPLCP